MSSAGDEPSREDCRPHIQREKEECNARVGAGVGAAASPSSSSGPLAAVMNVLFSESRLMQQRDLAIATRERDLIRLKVSSATEAARHRCFMLGGGAVHCQRTHPSRTSE